VVGCIKETLINLSVPDNYSPTSYLINTMLPDRDRHRQMDYVARIMGGLFLLWVSGPARASTWARAQQRRLHCLLLAHKTVDNPPRSLEAANSSRSARYVSTSCVR
jgi:hypothetical protein